MVREVVVEQGREAGVVGMAPRGSDRVLGGYLTRMVRRFARFAAPPKLVESDRDEGAVHIETPLEPAAISGTRLPGVSRRPAQPASTLRDLGHRPSPEDCAGLFPRL